MSPVPDRPLASGRYRIKQSLVIAQCAEMRVLDQTLAPGECVPWHLHPDSDDCVICLRGVVQVRLADPEQVATQVTTQVTTLRALDRCVVPKGRAHSTANTSAQDCQFLIVQGPGQVEFRALPEPGKPDGPGAPGA